jgi:hypothetical protein
MPKIKLTKTAVDAATPQERDYELRDTTMPGFLGKVTPDRPQDIHGRLCRPQRIASKAR